MWSQFFLVYYLFYSFYFIAQSTRASLQKDIPREFPGYDTKKSDRDSPVWLEL